MMAEFQLTDRQAEAIQNLRVGLKSLGRALARQAPVSVPGWQVKVRARAPQVSAKVQALAQGRQAKAPERAPQVSVPG